MTIITWGKRTRKKTNKGKQQQRKMGAGAGEEVSDDKDPYTQPVCMWHSCRLTRE
jgi:hypothetical protein